MPSLAPTPTIPAVAGLPVLGSALTLLRNPLDMLRRSHARLGPIFRVRAATRSFVVLAGHQANRFVATEGRDALASGPFWESLTDYQGCPHSILALDGPAHRSLRQLYQEDLSRSVVEAQAGGLQALTLQTLGEMNQDRGFSARGFCRLLVSRQVHHLLSQGGTPIDAPTVHALTEVFRYHTNILLLRKWPRAMLYAPSLLRHTRTAQRFVAELMARAGDNTPPGWFASVERGRLEHPELFSEGDVRASYMLPFVAGVDTVGSTLAFLLHELAHDAALRERVQRAVDSCYEARGGALPTVDALRGADDLRGAVLEALRLYPAAFAIYRQARRDFQFDGRQVRRGEDVLVFTTATHTDPRHFADPYRFDVERFRAPRNEHKQRFVFAPYGGGPHVCLGAGMGEAQLVLTLAVLLRHCELRTARPGRRYGAVFDPSLSLDDRFAVCMAPRQL